MLGMAFSSVAALQNAFPGKYKADIVGIEAANVVSIYVNVWAGFPRTFRVTLPNIAIPINHPKAPACQLDLIAKAKGVTEKFFEDAKYIEVRNIMLESTDDMDTSIDIFTNKGSLSNKLKAEGVARPDTVDELKPWC